ncbi:hypothetical protein L227DRAFT_553667 [Lentinus tigrinus ALCF2SS1-6]|uniref:F-box domain-containing protein n=1 Tax=Lentinus tigrinus ALCF2SS1-6 TaxID=1328759 RepID=A0A5C2RZD3_9APHY|nr:hypothetical protein L227DRAFT_553667 [Lentinus tigrinus ALCF2SS1-6]
MPMLTDDIRLVDMAERLLCALRDSRTRLGLDVLKHLEETATATLALARSGINTYASINTLPAEVLGIIFQNALPSGGRGFPFNGYEDPRMGEEVRSRTVLAHVCQRWRHIALDMASFWTVIDEFSHDSSSAFLARSGDMPLQVYVKQTLCRDAGHALVPHGPRIRDLHLSIPKERRSVIPSTTTLFPFDPKNLERLCIVTEAMPFDDSRPNIHIDMPPVLFPGPTPHLKMLILRSMCWLPGIPYSNLTHLHMTRGTPISLITLLTFLGHCTALEELVLVDIFIASATAVPLDHAITLPRLRMLVLGINQSHLSMRRLLQYLSLPSTVTLRVNGAYAFRALSDLRPFPELPFTASFDTLSIDHASRHLVVRASGPSSALLLDFKEYPTASHDHAIYLMESIIPFDNIVDLRYRSHTVHAQLAVHLLADAHMPSLRKFSFVDAGDVAVVPEPMLERREAYVHAISRALERSPNLAELQLWSADAAFPLRLGLRTSAPSLRTLVFYCSGTTDEVLDMDAFHQQAQEAKVYSFSQCEAPLTIAGVDPVHHIYEW